MSRTTEAAVKAILGRHYDDVTSLVPFIDTANLLVTRVDSGDDDGLLSVADLEMIERYLAAHFYTYADQIAQSRSTSGASGSFQGTTGLYLDGSQYGQAAKVKDATGQLAAMEQLAKLGGVIDVEAEWVGKAPDTQLTAEERGWDR